MGIFSEYAPRYAALGYSVLPIRERAKAPALIKWKDRAPLSPTEIAAEAEMHPEANIAVRTGDGLMVLDVDDEEALERLVLANGPLPHTHTVVTHRGYQLHFAVPDGLDRRRVSTCAVGAGTPSSRPLCTRPDTSTVGTPVELQSTSPSRRHPGGSSTSSTEDPRPATDLPDPTPTSRRARGTTRCSDTAVGCGATARPTSRSSGRSSTSTPTGARRRSKTRRSDGSRRAS